MFIPPQVVKICCVSLFTHTLAFISMPHIAHCTVRGSCSNLISDFMTSG